MSKMEKIHELINQLTEAEVKEASNMLEQRAAQLDNSRWGIDPKKKYLILQFAQYEGTSDYFLTGDKAIEWCNANEGKKTFCIYEAKHTIDYNCRTKKIVRYDQD